MASSGLIRGPVALLLCLLLLSSPERTSSQGLTGVVKGLVQPVVGTAAATLPDVGGILSLLIPYTSLLNGFLEQAVVRNNATQFTSDIVTQLTGIVGILLNATLPVPAPIRPDTEVRLYGFTGDAFNVTTPDGYILGVFRVRWPACNGTFAGVVVMPPSFLSNAATFLYLKNDSLAYRGDLYGRNHVNLSVTSQAFWDYNPYHWGAYDLPTQLEFVSNKTGSKRLQLVGYDIAGTAYAFMNHVHGQRYQQLVSSCSFMLPIFYLSKLTSLPFVALGLGRDLITLLGAVTLHGELAFFNPVVHSVFYNLCGRFSPLTCNYLFQFLAGPSEQIRYEAFPEAARNILDSISVQAVNWNFQQVGHRRRMSFYDFGTAVNQQRYGQATPPIVFLNRTLTPCRVYAMARATTTLTQDVLDGYNDLPASARTEFFNYPDFNSIGPILPKDANLIYNRVVAGVVQDTPRFNG